MGYALLKSDCKAVRRRPNKALRHNTQHAGNLTTYTHAVSRKIFERSTSQNLAKPKESISGAAEYAQLGAQPFDKTAANSDTASKNTGVWFNSVYTTQLTIALVGCLCTGAFVGHQWSTFAMQPQSFGSSVPAALVVVEGASVRRIETNDADAEQPVATDVVSPLTDGSKNRERQYAEEAEQYVSEIDWLKNQNGNLQVEVDALNRETSGLNRELLALELEVVQLQLLSKPPTETRIVYNFVNVPIGGSSVMQYDDQNDYVDESDSVDDDEYAQEMKLREWEAERAGYDDEGEAIYDPQTGYYVNLNYSGDNSEYEDDEGY